MSKRSGRTTRPPTITAFLGRLFRGEIVLPAGRELLATGEGELFALARDELGIERVEVYRKPGWAGG